jgi:hypothetical protein
MAPDQNQQPDLIPYLLSSAQISTDGFVDISVVIENVGERDVPKSSSSTCIASRSASADRSWTCRVGQVSR